MASISFTTVYLAVRLSPPVLVDGLSGWGRTRTTARQKKHKNKEGRYVPTLLFRVRWYLHLIDARAYSSVLPVDQGIREMSGLCTLVTLCVIHIGLELMHRVQHRLVRRIVPFSQIRQFGPLFVIAPRFV